MKKFATSIFATLLIFVLTTGVALGYEYAGYKWPTNNTLYTFTSSMPDAWEGPVYNAAITWNNTSADFSFYNSGSASNSWGAADYGAYNGYIAINNCYHSGSTITNDFTDFNTYYDWASDGSYAYDLQTIALHEFGHWLSLSHSEDGSAIMWYSWGKGEVQHGLSSDDIEGINYIY